MTSATAAPGTRTPTTPAAGGNALAGTRALVRFALRRDRVRLPVWLLALFLGTLTTAKQPRDAVPRPAGPGERRRERGQPGRPGHAAWIVPVYAFVVGHLGQILRFPDWMNNLSPFGHVPRLPAADMAWTPLFLLTLVAAGLVWLGLAGFRRRDLEPK